MSIVLNHTLVDSESGRPRTHGSVGARFGSARNDGTVSLYQWHGTTLGRCRNSQCSTYRKAQRKLLQWLKGYNV